MVIIKKAAGVKRAASSPGGSCSVFVRGFDFGTTDEQFEGHMSSVGTVENVKWITKGSAEVTYSSAEEAAAAIETLQKTTIDGNTRFIDVLPKTAGDHSAKRFKSGGGKGQWGKGNSWGNGGGGGGIMEALQSLLLGGGGGGGGGWGKGGGKGGKGGGGKYKNDDPAGSGRVFVRGFDFGTDDEQFEGHMKAAGPIHAVHWVTKGSAVVVYKKKASAVKAVAQLNQSIIDGNSRYIDVILKES